MSAQDREETQGWQPSALRRGEVPPPESPDPAYGDGSPSSKVDLQEDEPRPSDKAIPTRAGRRTGTREGDRWDHWRQAQSKRLSQRDARIRVARWRDHLRGLVTKDDTTDRLTRAWIAQQMPVPTGRRVFVVGAHGGAGASTTAVLLAQEVAGRRDDGVALVDDAPTRRGLTPLLTVEPELGVDDAGSTTLDRRGRLRVFSPPGSPAAAETLIRSLRRVAGLTVVDCGEALPSAPLPADALVLVAAVSARGADGLGDALHEARSTGWPPARVVVVLTPGPVDAGVRVTELSRRLSDDGLTVFALPQDRHLAGSSPIHLSLLAPRTALAVSEMAASAVTASLDAPVGSR